MKSENTRCRTFIAILLLFLAIVKGSDAFVGTPKARLVGPSYHLFRSMESTKQSYPIITNFDRPHVAKRNNIRETKLEAFPETIPALTECLFRYGGKVPIILAFGWNAFLFGLVRTKLFQMLTSEGYFHALALGTGLWATLGWRGWTTCVLYLFLGSAVTKVKMQEKEKLGIAEGRGGRRGPENVWGSAATGLACAIASVQPRGLWGIPSELFLLGYVASLATKLSDTFASEIGKAYGKTTFLITTFQRAEPGTEGAVSAEGTAASVVGGALMSLYGLIMGFLTPKAVPISIFAAFVATNIESVLGATLQGKKNLEWMTNEVVNFINTLIGAVIAIGCGMVLL